MPRKLDIELTSRRDDGSWTWRAPGAREPRGSVDGTLLPAGAAVGDVLRADAEFEIDGIFVTAVQPPKDKEASNGNEGGTRIEILGSGREQTSGVSVSLASGGRRRADSFDERPARRSRSDRDGSRDRGARPERGPRTERAERPDRAGRTERAERPDRPGRTDSADRPDRRGPRRPRPGTPGDEMAMGEGRSEPRDDSRRAPRPPRSARPGEATKDRRERRRLEPITTHRNAALATLRPEQLPVAEQLLRGGIPAVRKAIDEQNSRARNEDRAEISPEPLMAMAEELLPVMNLAAWKDRAVAARTAGRDAPLREVRSVVSASSTVTLDEDARGLLATLRESLDSRVKALRESWLGKITTSLENGRVADALRVSARPPEPGARLTGELAVRLAGAAGGAMVSELPVEEWTELLDAVVESPVRRNVKPLALPAEATEALLSTARRAAGFVPELAKLLGLPIPPPPGPRRPAATAGRRS